MAQGGGERSNPSAYAPTFAKASAGKKASGFAERHTRIKGIETFWNQAKRHMRKFNGVPKAHFGLFLKECEWRFNNSDPKAQLRQLKQWVKLYLR